MQSRISIEDCEILLPHKAFLPPVRQRLIVAAILAAIVGLAVWTEQGLVVAGLTAAIAFLVAIALFPWLYFWRSGQTGAPTSFTANLDQVAGYVKWPFIWPNSVLETPLGIAWSSVDRAILRLVPSASMPRNLQLELTLRDGRLRVVRLPVVADSDWSDLVATLTRIGQRAGFAFSVEPSNSSF